MNSLKTLMVMAVLGAAGYWMYMNVWQKPGSTPVDAQAFASQPSVQIPGLNLPASQLTGPTTSAPTTTPPALLGGGSAPAYAATPSPIPSTGTPMAGSPVADVAAAQGASGVTLISPPGATNTSGDPQVSASTAAKPSLLSGATASQTPAATYPPPYASTSPSAVLSADSVFQSKFDALIEAVRKKLGEGRLPEAQLALSSLYDNPDLPQAQARQVTELLDQLAGTVIYSRQHFLEQPYMVRPGDTLDQIAQKYAVPPLLLARINGISEGQPLEPGRELKVVRGPFCAVIHLEKHELSLRVDGRYAGRFAIGVGCDQPKLEGEYLVREKNINPAYRGPDGVTVPGGDPRNPLGKFWIGLSDKVGLHGTVDPQNIGRDDNRGAICLADRDIDDLYGILSVGSRVVIQR